MPRLPRKVPRRHGPLVNTSVPPDPAQCQKCHACQAKTKVDAPNCHACYVKRRWMSPSAMPATQSAAASRATSGDQARHQTQPSARSATPAMQNEGGCCQVPRRPRQTKVVVAKRHACHVKRRWTSPSSTAATQSAAASNGDQARHQTQPSARSATPATPNEGGCRQAPPLPRETKVDVCERWCVTKLCVKESV